jgi:hypothetical protein
MRAISTDQSTVPYQTVSTARRSVLRAVAAAGTLGALGLSPFVRPVAAASPGELAARAGVLVRVRAARQEVDGDTFSAEVVGRECGAGSGVMLLSTGRTRERYLVEGARVVCEAGQPTAVELDGTVVVVGHDGATTSGEFRASVERAEIEEGLIFDLTGSGVSPPKTIEVGGELHVAADACDRTGR